jgi:hypothetical protein
MLSQGEFPKGMDVKNMISQIGQKARWNPATFFGRLFPLADKMGMEAIHATNVSTLSSPDTKQWPYKKLFEDAGLPVPKDLRTRGAWMKRQLEVRGDAIANKIVSEKPGLVYLSGGEGKVIFDKVAPKGKVYEQEVKWTSGLGNEQKLTMKAVDLGGTRVVFGPHVTAQTGNAKPVVEARNALLSGDFSKASPVAAPAKVAPKKKGVDPKVADEIKARGGGSSGMADWSVLKLQKAYERAYDAGDDLKMRQIVQVLKNKGALVE